MKESNLRAGCVELKLLEWILNHGDGDVAESDGSLHEGLDFRGDVIFLSQTSCFESQIDDLEDENLNNFLVISEVGSDISVDVQHTFKVLSEIDLLQDPLHDAHQFDSISLFLVNVVVVICGFRNLEHRVNLYRVSNLIILVLIEIDLQNLGRNFRPVLGREVLDELNERFHADYLRNIIGGFKNIFDEFIEFSEDLLGVLSLDIKLTEKLVELIQNVAIHLLFLDPREGLLDELD